MRTLKKKDIKSYKISLKEGGYDATENIGNYYEEAIREFLSPILKTLTPVQQENVVMKIFDDMSDKMSYDADYLTEVEEFIKINYPKVYSRPELKNNSNGVEELDEFVNGVGAAISGDEKNVNNSEIKTAPQATTDDFNQVAIQPNRYLFNVSSVGPRVAGVSNEEINRLAKDKAISLLEGLDSDFNDNAIIDIKEFPSSVASHISNLINSIKKNQINDTNKIDMILNFIKNNVNPNA